MTGHSHMNDFYMVYLKTLTDLQPSLYIERHNHPNDSFDCCKFATNMLTSHGSHKYAFLI